MQELLGNLKRSHMCGNINLSHEGQQVVIMGWVNKRRDLGQLVFITVRDRSGVVQAVADENKKPELFKKAQGSEFPGVIIPVHMSAPGLLNRNLLYTAVTRAKRVCVMVGEERAVRAMVNNARQKTRNSGLAGRLADYCGQGE